MLDWLRFIRVFAITAGCSVACAYVFILMVDPYDSFSFSLPFEREPISTNQRFSYPALARNQAFDSVIIGTSTARLLKPERLNRLTRNNWVNLAMNSATAYEQMEMLKLFLRHHPNVKHVVIGVDDAWCQAGNDLEKFTFRPFPPWLYDENRWNDFLYIFNDKALENAVRMIEYWLGKREAKYDWSGYRDFTEDFGEYDLFLARSRIYAGDIVPKGLEHDLLIDEVQHSPSAGFDTFNILKSVIQMINNQADTTILMMPLHGYYLSKGAENYRACKRELHTTVGSSSRIRFLDRMRIDNRTLDDENYWDPLHFRHSIAKELEDDLAKVVFE